MVDDMKQDGRLKGKVAIITGAGSGIGLATAQRFLEEGAQVAAVGSSEKVVRQWQGTENVLVLRADITQLEEIQRVVRETVAAFGRIDALCNVAGINDLNYPLLDTDDARWDRVMDLDLKAPFRLCREAVPVMIQGGGGSIVNVGSYAALRGNHGPSYTAAKAGLVGLTKSMARELAGRGVTCNAVAPGYIDTDMTGQLPEKAKEALMAQIPAKRIGRPEDVARAVAFLVSDEAGYITGEVLRVDGGLAM